jgi:Domain of unknown function DUF1828
MNDHPCELIESQIGGLFSCAEANGQFRIRTPYLYPDGDVIDLFLRPHQDGGATLSDLGETLRWLRMQTVAQRRSPKQRRLIDDTVLTHGVELYRGMLTTRVENLGEGLAAATTRLAQAALRVSDLWFTFRTRAVESITDEVADFLRELEVPFERGETLPGRSGRVWRVDFHTRTEHQSSLVYVLSTGSRAAARGVAEHVLAGWYDLGHMKAGHDPLQFISLFDDTLDVWTEEDFRLVEPLSEVTRWSQPDEFVQLLAA